MRNSEDRSGVVITCIDNTGRLTLLIEELVPVDWQYNDMLLAGNRLQLIRQKKKKQGLTFMFAESEHLTISDQRKCNINLVMTQK